MEGEDEVLENLARGLAEKNLARSRYTLAAGAAHGEGLAVVQALFLRTAEQERVHGRQFARLSRELGGGEVRAEGVCPLETAESAAGWLRQAQREEARAGEEWRAFARQARQAGAEGAAALFDQVAQVDGSHGARFGRWADRLEAGELFVRPSPCRWRCLACGHTQAGRRAPERCPLCRGGQSQFFPLEEAWF